MKLTFFLFAFLFAVSVCFADDSFWSKLNNAEQNEDLQSENQASKPYRNQGGDNRYQVGEKDRKFENRNQQDRNNQRVSHDLQTEFSLQNGFQNHTFERRFQNKSEDNKKQFDEDQRKQQFLSSDDGKNNYKDTVYKWIKTTFDWKKQENANRQPNEKSRQSPDRKQSNNNNQDDDDNQNKIQQFQN